MEKLLLALHPQLQIPAKWSTLWDEQQQKGFKATAGIYCIFWCLTYLAHYFFVDVPLKKEPLSDWAFYRFSCAIIMVIALVLSFWSKCYNSKLRKLPLALAGLYICYMQATSMVWRPEIPYFYITLLPVLTALTLSTSVLLSGIYLSLGYFVTLHGLIARPNLIAYILSSHLAGMVFVVVIRSSYANKVKAFLATNESIESNRKIIQLQTEIQEQIKSFLPKVIYEDFRNKIDEQNVPANEAFNQVVNLKEDEAAILYSDIRGFTKSSRIDEAFLKHKVIPNLKKSAKIIEDNLGVPRQIGDLMFAYFTKGKNRDKIESAIKSSFDLIKSTLNEETSKHDLKRHSIISFGKVLVGNVGGEEYSKEITVHGDAANIGSRIDTITKSKKFLNQFEESVIIFSPDLEFVVRGIFPKMHLELFEIDTEVPLRDFEEITSLLVIRYNIENINALQVTNGQLSKVA